MTAIHRTFPLIVGLFTSVILSVKLTATSPNGSLTGQQVLTFIADTIAW